MNTVCFDITYSFWQLLFFKESVRHGIIIVMAVSACTELFCEVT